MLLIRKPSLFRETSYISDHDDALAWPDAANVAAVESFKHALEVARDTGDYAPVLIAGKPPLVFTLRHVPANTLRRLADALASKAIGGAEWTALCFRLALTGVVGADVTIGRAHDERWGELAAADVVDTFPAHIVTEVGLFVAQRGQPDPKR